MDFEEFFSRAAGDGMLDGKSRPDVFIEIGGHAGDCFVPWILPGHARTAFLLTQILTA